MKRKIITASIISLLGVSYAGNWVAIINLERKIESQKSTITKFSDWIDVGEIYECDEWTPSVDTIDLDVSFEQEQSCKKDQEREVTTYKINNGLEELISLSIENQTIVVTKTQTAIGTKSNLPLKLIGNNTASGDAFGGGIAISGNTAIVGSIYEDTASSNSGAAYIFTYEGSEWIQQAKLKASDPSYNNYLGFSVSISGDIAVVGATGERTGGSNAGAAYVFTRNGTTWTQEAKLMADDIQAGDYFGYAVSISGNTIVIGARAEDSVATDSGSAYVFTRNGTTWTQEAKLIASDASGSDYFGDAVSISGNTIIVGASLQDTGKSNSGAAYVFTRSGTTWTQEAKLKANVPVATSYFGYSVSLDNNTAIIGSRLENTEGTDAGAAYIFTRNGTAWTQQAKLIANDIESGDQYGRSVSISGDIAIVGAMYEDTAGTDAGAAYIFTRNGTTWTEKNKIMGENDNDGLGSYVAISENFAIVGARGDDTKGSGAGAAYVFNP